MRVNTNINAIEKVIKQRFLWLHLLVVTKHIFKLFESQANDKYMNIFVLIRRVHSHFLLHIMFSLLDYIPIDRSLDWIYLEMCHKNVMNHYFPLEIWWFTFLMSKYYIAWRSERWSLVSHSQKKKSFCIDKLTKFFCSLYFTNIYHYLKFRGFLVFRVSPYENQG